MEKLLDNEFMQCDICERCDCKHILILNPKRFSEKNLKKAKRVCWNCAGRLFLERKYNFCLFWREAFYDALVGRIPGPSLESTKAKYMVIHE